MSGEKQERLDRLERLERSGALCSGHFRLTSGLHSGNYIQCARALVQQDDIRFFAEKLATILPPVDYIISPAIGALVIGYKVADVLNKPFVFAERDGAGNMAFRRGLQVPRGARVAIVEDVITTGGSVAEVIGLLEDMGALVVKVISMVRRNDIGHIRNVPLESLVFLDFVQYDPKDCPLCEMGKSIEKPGSRK